MASPSISEICKPHLVGIDQYFQQFLDDKPAVIDLRFIDKPGKAAYIRNKKQAFVFHFTVSYISRSQTYIFRSKCNPNPP